MSRSQRASEYASGREINLEKILDTLFEQGFQFQANDPKRLTSLRFSGLPFCPIKYFLNLPQALATRSKKDFRFMYYTEVGTTVHNVFQAGLASFQTPWPLIADWKCDTCSHVVSFCTKPAECTKCKSTLLSFKEIEVNLNLGGSDILGHVDTAFKVKDVYKLVDWKTTSIKNLASSLASPNPTYLSQIKNYVAGLYVQYNAVFDESYLGFVPRDDPFKTKFYKLKTTDKELQQGISNLTEWSKQHQAIRKISTIQELKPFILSRPCAKSQPKEYSDCKYTRWCAGNRDGCVSLVKDVFLKIQTKLPLENS